MSAIALTARPYAAAAFASAQKRGDAPEWRARLQNLSALAASPEFASLLARPGVSVEQVLAVCYAAAGESSGDDDPWRRFLQALAENRRLNLAGEIARQFAEMSREAEGVVQAVIETAKPLDKEAKKSLADALAAKSGGKVEMEERETPELLGGVRIRLGDNVVDASVQGRLARLAAAVRG